jgi:two-component system sensor histidine kinase MtrB
VTTPTPKPRPIELGPPTKASARSVALARHVVALKRLLRRLAKVPALKPLARRARPVVRRVYQTWRRSLQLRMVTITLLASSLLVGGFGALLVANSTRALIEGAESDSEATLNAGLHYMNQQLQNLPDGEDPNTEAVVQQLLTNLALRPEQGGGVVVVMRSFHSDVLGSNTMAPSSADVQGAITAELEAKVAGEAAGGGRRGHQLVTLPGKDGKSARTYLVYGAPMATKWQGSARTIELYYLVPANTEMAVAEDFRTMVSVVGAALVLLLSLVVALVTRLVVHPVRIAARTAQRLSAGLLDQRMDVKGEDDLALLAAAFNQMAANLQRQIVRLEEMSRLQRRFTSDVSHELRTPLTTVRMAADLIHSQREDFDPAVSRSAELLQTELDRFEELLTDLLEISRFDAGFAQLDAEPTDLVPIIRRVCDRLEPVAARVGVELVIEAPPPPVIADIDPRRVERVLRNLVDNAIDHGHAQPVTIRLAADEHAIAITVRDHGIGLKPGEERLVFNRFWRADPSRARQTGGTGLGLSISVEDARLHGGQLEAWGAPGRGAQFRLTLPVRAGGRAGKSPLPLIPLDEIAAPADQSSPGVPVVPSQAGQPDQAARSEVPA